MIHPQKNGKQKRFGDNNEVTPWLYLMVTSVLSRNIRQVIR